MYKNAFYFIDGSEQQTMKAVQTANMLKDLFDAHIFLLSQPEACDIKSLIQQKICMPISIASYEMATAVLKHALGHAPSRKLNMLDALLFTIQKSRDSDAIVFDISSDSLDTSFAAVSNSKLFMLKQASDSKFSLSQISIHIADETRQKAIEFFQTAVEVLKHAGNADNCDILQALLNMKSMKESIDMFKPLDVQLSNECNELVDIVVVHSASSTCLQLKSTLRSLEKNGQGIRQIFIAGQIPHTLKTAKNTLAVDANCQPAQLMLKCIDAATKNGAKSPFIVAFSGSMLLAPTCMPQFPHLYLDEALPDWRFFQQLLYCGKSQLARNINKDILTFATTNDALQAAGMPVRNACTNTFMWADASFVQQAAKIAQSKSWHVDIQSIFSSIYESNGFKDFVKLPAQAAKQAKCKLQLDDAINRKLLCMSIAPDADNSIVIPIQQLLPTKSAFENGNGLNVAVFFVGGDSELLENAIASFKDNFLPECNKLFFAISDSFSKSFELKDCSCMSRQLQHGKNDLVLRKLKPLLEVDKNVLLNYEFIAIADMSAACKKKLSLEQLLNGKKYAAAKFKYGCLKKDEDFMDIQSSAHMRPDEDISYVLSSFLFGSSTDIIELANAIEAWRCVDIANSVPEAQEQTDDPYLTKFFASCQDSVNFIDDSIFY